MQSLDNWKKIKLWDIINTMKWFAFKSKWFWSWKNPIVKVSNFTMNSISTDDLAYVDDWIKENYDKYSLMRKDILIQTVGSWPSNINSVVWKVVRVPPDLWWSLLNQNIVKIIPKESVDNDYLYYHLKWKKFFSYIIWGAQWAASQASITLDHIRNYNLYLPPLPTQQKIANILSKYDDLIENNTRRIKILEEQAQLIYNEWFVKFKFPWYEDVKMVDSGTEFGEIPEGWEVKKVWDEILIKKWKNITKSTIVEWKIPVVAWWLTPAYYHNEPNVDWPVITMSASWANSWYVNIYYENIRASDCGYLSKEQTDKIYFYYTQFKYRQKDLTHLQRWAAQPHVYPKDVMNMSMIVSNMWIEEQFEKIIEPIYEEIWNLQKQNQNLKETRDMLIPKLVSGEVEV